NFRLETTSRRLSNLRFHNSLLDKQRFRYVYFRIERFAGGPMKRIHGLVLMTLLALIPFVTYSSFAQTSARVYVVNNVGETISIVNARTLAVEHTVATGRNPHELAVAPDGSKAYVGNVAENSVSVIDLKTNTEKRKITSPYFMSPHGIAFTPDSRRAVVTSERA